MNNINDILNTNIGKNIIWVAGLCGGKHHIINIFARNLCKNCGAIRCEDCIVSDNSKCVGCIENKTIPERCYNCCCNIWLRICKKCGDVIQFCSFDCDENDFKYRNGFYCKKCCSK